MLRGRGEGALPSSSTQVGEPVGERVAKVEASLSELSGRLKALEDAARG